jgi:AAHS family benzoate transporter-like MFS transporter
MTDIQKEISLFNNKYETFYFENEDNNNEIIYYDDKPVIDQILDNKGYDTNTFLNISLTFLILCIEGLHMSLFSCMIIPLTNYYSLSSYMLKIISGSIFIGVGLGSLTSGSLALKYGRPLTINWFLVIIFISNVLISISDNYLVFLVFRFIIGYGLGVIVPMSLNFLTEYLPIQNRALVLTSVWVGFAVGNLYLLLLMLWVMPNFEIENVQLTLYLTCLFPLFTLIMTKIYMEDTPRNLILRGKSNEGIYLLEKMSKSEINKKYDLKIRIIREVQMGINKDLNSEVSTIFTNPSFCLLSVLLAMIWFIDSVICYGPFVVSTLTMQNLGIVENNEGYSQIIINQIIICLINAPSNIIGGILCELSFLGRNKSTLISLFFGVFFTCLLLQYPKDFTFYFSLSQAFASIAFNITTTYTCEVYPTRIRDQALGFMFFCTRLGGFLSQILFLTINEHGMWDPYYATVILICINIFFILLIPYETYGKPLDIDFEQEKKMLL